MRKFIPLLLLVSVVVVSGCIGPSPPQNLDNVVITLVAGPCEGSCPVYSVEISGNGEVVYQGNKFVAVDGEQKYLIPKERVKALVDEFYKINFFSLPNEYPFVNIDASVTTISITVDGKEKEVRFNSASSTPLSLFDLAAFIYKAADADQWVVLGKCGKVQDKETCEKTPDCEPWMGSSVCQGAVCSADIVYKGCKTKVCEIASKENLCASVTCPDGQACFEGKCISTASEKISLSFEGYAESCTDEPRLFVEKNSGKVEVQNYLWDKAPIYVNGKYEEFPTWCDNLVCSNISEYPIDVELISYELIGTKNCVPEYTTVPIKEPVTVELNYYKTEDDCNKKVNAQKFSQVYNSESSGQTLCQQAGGEWKTLSNGCVDSCDFARRTDIMCTQALTDGCDCGSDKCWNGKACEAN